VAQWRKFPEHLCQSLGRPVHAYSRAGYGQSAFGAARYLPDFMHLEAQALLQLDWFNDLCATQKPVLLGHSDGASIALLAASMAPERIGAVVVLAPHLVVEPITLQGIEAVKRTADTTDFIEKLRRYHANPERMFWRWCDIWLDPRFRTWSIEQDLLLGTYPGISCPVLAIQGLDDAYGTASQVERLAQVHANTQKLLISNCNHNPHLEHPQVCLDAISAFLNPHARSA
jgi:pimeloyl-ACP methyl ester carboxylesterase